MQQHEFRTEGIKNTMLQLACKHPFSKDTAKLKPENCKHMALASGITLPHDTECFWKQVSRESSSHKQLAVRKRERGAGRITRLHPVC